MRYSFLQKILFTLSPETAHYVALFFLKIAHTLRIPLSSTIVCSPKIIMGLSFPNPIGLAAGLDKNGDYIDALASLGFGFIEVGTVTPKPQKGNPKPRLFRLPEHQAIINRMGFNNKGVDYLIQRVKQAKFKGILGINIGKNRDTPLEKAIDDYVYGFEHVYPYASYVTINISSPNTPMLRDLQHGNLLTELLRALKKKQALLAELHKKYVPLVVKISPDLTQIERHELAAILLAEKIDGVIATNTTLSREGVEGDLETGGLSGKPLQARSTQMIKDLYSVLQNQIPIIGCGGIFIAADVKEKMEAGAELIQVYTGFVYRGPGMVGRVARRFLP